MADDALAPFVAKWLAREPEMLVAEVFCPASMRLRYRAWGALLHEIREALFELSDPRVTTTKSGWWAEELMGLEQGRSRHPLTSQWVNLSAPWTGLGRSLLEATQLELRPGSTDEAIESLLPAARATVSVEAAVFVATASDEGARAMAVHWLLSRLPSGLETEDRARIPMHLFARHGLAPGTWETGQGEELLRDWARELARVLPENPQGTQFRRVRTAFDRARLQRLAAGKGVTQPPAMATLWRAWQASRGRG
jgi:hypothetical protein